MECIRKQYGYCLCPRCYELAFTKEFLNEKLAFISDRLNECIEVDTDQRDKLKEINEIATHRLDKDIKCSCEDSTLELIKEKSKIE